LGAHTAVKYVDLLRRLVAKHHDLYVRLYPRGAVSPNFHHILHLCDNITFLGCLLSCFVTERKHIKTKHVALHVFRAIDKVVITQMVNHQCEQIRGADCTLFRKIYQIRPKPHVHGKDTYMTSTTAVLACGSVHRDDIVYLSRGVVGKVIRFWGKDYADVEKLAVEVLLFRSAECRDRWTTTGAVVDVVSNLDVIDTCTWAPIRNNIIQVIPPCRTYLPSVVA
jgi:hypothetical protein